MKLWTAIAVVGLVVVGCAETPAHKTHRESVVFEVGGDVRYATYDDDRENGIEYPDGVTRVELTGDNVPQPPKVLYTWADTAEGRDSTSWCRITVDGIKVVEEKAVGEANDAMCLYAPTA